MSDFFNVNTERHVLANLIKDGQEIEKGIRSLTILDFYDPQNRQLYDIFVRFYNKYYQCISYTTLERWLTKNAPNNKGEILLRFTEVSAMDADKYTKYYIDQLRQLSLKRNLYGVYKKIQTGLEQDSDPEDLIRTISREILQENSTSNIIRTSFSGDIDERIKLYHDKKAHPEKYMGIAYGIDEIDELTGGMYPGQLYLVVGRTGAGKSRFLFNIGCNAAKFGKRVMYCTIEMEAAIIQHMWESRELDIPLMRILRTRLTPDEEFRYLQFLREAKTNKIPFHIVDIPQGCTTGLINTEVHTHEKMFGAPPDIVLIDYANLIGPVERYRDRTEKFDNVFRELKQGARASHIPFYTAAQLNREAIKAKTIGTEHVAFSDAASHHCDGVFSLTATEEDEREKSVSFGVTKGRYHGKTEFSLYWDREINLISSWKIAGLAQTPSAILPGDNSGSNSNISGGAAGDFLLSGTDDQTEY